VAAQRSLHSEQKQWQKRQHPRESNHTHGIEQDKPRGMKNRGQNNELQQNDKTFRKPHPTIPRVSPESDTG
jgi:hypothetical protein